MKAWIQAFRLRTIPLSLSCIVTGSFLAHFLGDFQWRIFIAAALTTVLLQILSNLANDYGDSVKGVDDETRKGPVRAIQSGQISAQQMKVAIVVFSLLSLLSGVVLLQTAFGTLLSSESLIWFIVGLGAIAAAIKYTVGKNPYGYNSLGDLFVFIFFGIVGVTGSYYLQSKNLDATILLPAASIGLLCVGVLNLNNMRDRIQDQEKGKVTLAVKLGFENAKWYQYSLIIGAALLLIVFTMLNLRNPYQWLFLLALPALILIINRVKKIKEPLEFDPLLKVLALSTFFLSLAFSLGLYLA